MLNKDCDILTRDPTEIKEVCLGSEDFSVGEFIAVARHGAVVN